MADQIKSPLDEVLSVKCRTHIKNDSDLLHISLNESNHRVCTKCLTDSQVDQTEVVNLKTLFDPSYKSILDSYTYLQDQELRERVLKMMAYPVEDFNDKLLSGIDLILRKVSDKIKEFKKKIQTFTHHLRSYQNKIHEEYNKIANLKNVQETVLNASRIRGNVDELNTVVKSLIICDKSSGYQRFLDTIKSYVDQFEEHKCKIGFNKFEQLSDEIICLINKTLSFPVPLDEVIQNLPTIPVIEQFSFIHFENQKKITQIKPVDNKLIFNNNLKSTSYLFSEQQVINKDWYIINFKLEQADIFIGLINYASLSQNSKRDVFGYYSPQKIGVIKKGNQYIDHKVYKECQIIFNISKKVMIISDLHNHDNIIELYPQDRQSDQNKQFCLCFSVPPQDLNSSNGSNQLEILDIRKTFGD